MKKLLYISIIFELVQGTTYAQVDSIIGTYKSLSYFINSPTIIIYPDSTFGYISPIDIGYVPETKGKVDFSNDTIFFIYPNNIHPEIKEIDKKNSEELDTYKISIEGNFQNEDVYLYINEPLGKNGRIKAFNEDGEAVIDSLNATDSLFIHVGMYSWIPIKLDVVNFKEYYYKIILPEIPTIYCLNQEKAIIKNGFIYFSDNTDKVSFYNINIYKTKKDIKKMYQLIKK